MRHINRTRRELAEDAPVRYHRPHLCCRAGGEVLTFAVTYPGDRPELVLECQDCQHEVEPEETLTDGEMTALEALVPAGVLAKVGAIYWPGHAAWAAYQEAIAMVRRGASQCPR